MIDEIAQLNSFDNSLLTVFKTCPRKFLHRFIAKPYLREVSTDLVSGGAYAKGMEAFRLAAFWYHKTEEEAIQAGLEAIRSAYGDHIPTVAGKSLDRVIAGFLSYHKRFPLKDEVYKPIIHEEDNPGIELHFSVPIPDLINPFTQTQTFYFGTLDALVSEDASNKTVFILDDKTTSSFSTNWHDSWLFNSQMLGYTWATREIGYKTLGVFIRGTALLKTKITHDQAVIVYPQFLLDRWLMSIKLLIKSIWQAAESEDFRYELSYLCTYRGGCPYLNICKSPTHQQGMFFKGSPNESTSSEGYDL